MADPHWIIDPVDFPRTGNARERLHFLLRYAILAPSSHNTQPWLFALHDDHVDVLADRTRALPVSDPHDRELIMSCGAAVEMLVIAARAHGFTCDVDLSPSSDPDRLARIRLAAEVEPTEADLALRDAIVSRVTDRRAFAAEPIPADVQEEMRAAAQAFGIGVNFVCDDATRHALADMIAEGDRIQLADPSFRRELAQWVHPRRMGDGISFAKSAMVDEFYPIMAFVLRTFDVGKGRAAKDRELAEHSPLLSILSTVEDRATDWVMTGRALAALSLAATRHGLVMSYLNQPIEVPSLRPKLADLITSGRTPQLLMRFGVPRENDPPMPHAARRPLDQVVV